MQSNPGVLWFYDFDGCNYKISFGAASVLEVGRDGFVKLLMLNVIGMLESSSSNSSSTLTSLLHFDI